MKRVNRPPGGQVRGSFRITYVTVETMKPINLSETKTAKETKALLEPFKAMRGRLRELVDQKQNPQAPIKVPEPSTAPVLGALQDLEPIAVDWSLPPPDCSDAFEL
jgi:hypothetical protein